MYSKSANFRCWFTALAVCVMSVMAFSVSAELNAFDSQVEWKIGEKNSYTLTSTRSKTSGDQQTPEATTYTDVDIVIVDNTANGYLVSWTFGETQFDDPELSANPIVATMSNLLTGFEMLLELSVDGSISGVKNWKEVQSKSYLAIEALSQNLKQNGTLPDAQIAKMEQQVKAMYGSREQITLLTTREAQLFFMVMGKHYRLGEKFAYQLELANPFGGAPFPAYATIELEKLNTETELAKVVWQQQLDNSESKRIMLDTMTAIATRMGKPAPTEVDIPMVDISDFGEFNIEVNSGWMQEFQYRRVTTIGKDVQSNTLRMIKR